MLAVVVPAVTSEPIRVVDLRREGGSTLAHLQELVGGWIESVPVHGREDDLALYINEEGKFTCVDEEGRPMVNRRLTEWLVDGNEALRFTGENLYPGDFIAGPGVLVGFDPEDGENRDCPADIVAFCNRRSEGDTLQSQNVARADWGQSIVQHGAQLTNVWTQEPAGTAVIDVLAYIAHFCDRLGLDPGETFDSGLMSYRGDEEDGAFVTQSLSAIAPLAEQLP